MCDCPICKTIRETFDVNEGQEHEIIERLVESTNLLSEICNAVNETLQKGVEVLDEKECLRERFMPSNLDGDRFVTLYEENELSGDDDNERGIL